MSLKNCWKKKKRKRINKDRVDVSTGTPGTPGDKNKKPPVILKKGQSRRPIKQEVNEVDVQKQIRETLEKLPNNGVNQHFLNVFLKN